MNSRMLITGVVVCALYFPTCTFAVVINEIRIDQPGADTDEYFELAGSPGTSLDGLSYIVIGDGTGGSGVIESVTDLTGQVIPEDGFFLAAESTFSLAGDVDLTTSLNFENGDNVTQLLVSGLTAANGSDLDSNDDGILDSTPWTGILDSVALLNSSGSGDRVYSNTFIGPVDDSVPAYVFRDPDTTGSWQPGPLDTAGGQDSPGTMNSSTVVTVSEPGTSTLLAAGCLVLMLSRRIRPGREPGAPEPGYRISAKVLPDLQPVGH